MHNAINVIDRVLVRGGFRCFEASALVDRYINNRRALFHFRQLRTADQFGGGSTGDEYSANHHVRFAHQFDSVAGAGLAGFEVAPEHIV